MAFLFDNITAFLVGATLLVGLLFVQQRGRQSAVEATVRYRAEVQMASFVETLARDLENARTREQAKAALGLYQERLRPDGTREGGADLSRALSIYGTASQTEWLEFVTLADPDAGSASPLIAVAYFMKETGQTATARGVARPVFEVVRWVCTDPCRKSEDWRPQGGSVPAVVGFQVRAEPGGAVGRLAALPSSVAVTVEAAYATPARQAGDQRETAEFGLTRQGATVRVYAAGTGGASTPGSQNGARGIPPPPWTDRYVAPPPPPPAPSPSPGSPTPPAPTPTQPSSPRPAPPAVVRPSGPDLDNLI